MLSLSIPPNHGMGKLLRRWCGRVESCTCCLYASPNQTPLVPSVPTYPHKKQAFDNGRTLLRADYSIDCDVSEHTSYRALAITMAIVYPIGSLGTFSAVLWKYRDLLYPHQIRGRSKEDNAIAQEAKRANAFALRQFRLLHDACECVGNWTARFPGRNSIKDMMNPQGCSLILCSAFHLRQKSTQLEPRFVGARKPFNQHSCTLPCSPARFQMNPGLGGSKSLKHAVGLFSPAWLASPRDQPCSSGQRWALPR